MNAILSPKIKLGIFFLLLAIPMIVISQSNYKEYSGKVLNEKNNRTLESVSLSLSGTNIGTITNADGEFILKIPESQSKGQVVISLMGFKTKTVLLSQMSEGIVIELAEIVTELSAVNISAYKDAGKLVQKVFNEKSKTLNGETLYMTGFYRETIKRRSRNVALTEAVVNISKQPYNTNRRDAIKLGKARKRTDYKRLDTVSVKLQGGPYSTIYLDLMKYPEYIFNDETITAYQFSFDTPTNLNNRNVFVVNFKPKGNTLNINYEGKLYIDVSTLGLVSARYALDLSNEEKSKNLLVKKKPRDVEVFPLEANYHVDYKESAGRWYYSYANLDLKFKVKKKRRLFNQVYTLNSELAVTDWEIDATREIKYKDRLKTTVIITDAISGFSDPDFWGEFNLIEPDKSIESAIEKIQKNIKKQEENKKGDDS